MCHSTVGLWTHQESHYQTVVLQSIPLHVSYWWSVLSLLSHWPLLQLWHSEHHMSLKEIKGQVYVHVRVYTRVISFISLDRPTCTCTYLTEVSARYIPGSSCIADFKEGRISSVSREGEVDKVSIFQWTLHRDGWVIVIMESIATYTVHVFLLVHVNVHKYMSKCVALSVQSSVVDNVDVYTTHTYGCN